MLNVLYKYLVLTNHVGIPGIGNFSIERSDSQFRGASIHPPVREVLFQPGSALTDKNFYHFLAQEKNISEVDAVRKFQDFAYDLKKCIQLNPFVEITGLGFLKRNNTGEIYFESTLNPDRYLPVLTPGERSVPVPEQTVLENGDESTFAEDTIVKRDRWWIWAAVLAFLALAAIFYYYSQETGF
jgi:hypothetical protein